MCLALIVATFFLPEGIVDFLFGPGFALAVGTVGGEIDTEGTQEDRLKRDVAPDITEHKPEVFRLDTALRRIPSSPLEAEKAEWEEVGQFPRISDIVNATDISASNSGDPTDVPLGTITAGGNTIKQATYFIKDDICRVLDTATESDEAGWAGKRAVVTAVNESANTATVRAYDSTGILDSVPAIPANSKTLELVRMGNLKSEKDGAGDPRMMKPEQRFNFIHTFEKYVSISKLRKKFRTYTEDDMKRAIRQSIYDFRLDTESILWDGVELKAKHPVTNDRVYAMRGLESYITSNRITLPAVGSITEADLIDWGEKVGSDSHGSEEKMFYVSPSLWSELTKINLIKDTLSSKRSETVLGGEVLRIKTGHADLLLQVHKGFPLLGKKRYGGILDVMHLKKRIVEPFERKNIDPEESGGARIEGQKYLETSTMEVRYEKTHAILS